MWFTPIWEARSFGPQVLGRVWIRPLPQCVGLCGGTDGRGCQRWVFEEGAAVGVDVIHGPAQNVISDDSLWSRKGIVGRLAPPQRKPMADCTRRLP